MPGRSLSLELAELRAELERAQSGRVALEEQLARQERDAAQREREVAQCERGAKDTFDALLQCAGQR